MGHSGECQEVYNRNITMLPSVERLSLGGVAYSGIIFAAPVQETG